MTGVCSTDRWSCPNCGGTLTRDTQSQAVWLASLRAVQAHHGRRCSRTESVK